MDPERIRKMTDSEMKDWFLKLSKRNVKYCAKCNNEASKIVKVSDGESTKQLCGLCEKCYKDFIDYLNTVDVLWR